MRRALSLLFLFLFARVSLLASERVRFHPDWFPGAPFAGLYVALDRGIFRDAGLDVELVPFAFGQDAPRAMDVDPETAALGSAEGYIFLQQRARGTDVVAFTAVLRESPAGLISLTENPIASARDFAGRTLGVHRFADGMFRWFAAEAGLAPVNYTLRIVGNDLDELASGALAAQQGYAIEEFVQAQRRFGADRVRFLSFRELGFSSYAQVVYATRAQVARHAATFELFVLALRRGWQHALAHPDDALAAVMSRLEATADAGEQAAMLRALPVWIAPDGAEPLRPLDAGKWRRCQEVAQAMGLIVHVEDPAAFSVE